MQQPYQQVDQYPQPGYPGQPMLVGNQPPMGMGMPPQMMANPQMMMNPQLMMPGMIIYQGKWGLDKLREQPGIFVKHRFDVLEAVTGCERNKHYNIFAIDGNGDKTGHPIFRAHEKATWCSRNCLPAHCQPFTMQIRNKDPISMEIDESEFLFLQRDCKFTCCCCNRPEMTVNFVERGAQKKLGKAKHPFLCCDLGLNIYDAEDKIKYYLRGSCCQLGTCCQKCPCDPCQLVSFDLQNEKGEKIGSLEKRSQGCVKTILSDAGSFSMVYPPDATEEDKALLMSSIMLLDFMYFEQNPPDKNRKEGLLEVDVQQPVSA